MSSAQNEPSDPEHTTPSDLARSDAESWARFVSTLDVSEVPAEAINLNVAGRRVVSPMQGFGRMWQKTYEIDLGDAVSARELVRIWKAEFAKFWPARNWFFGPLTGIAPGEVAVLNLGMPARFKLSTGVLVLYADDEAFTFMTPEGHQFAAWITFSGSESNGLTKAKVHVLLRANDPIYEIALPLGGSRMEDRFWGHTLRSLAARFGVQAPVQMEAICIDKRRQWSRASNIRYNAAIRTAIYMCTAPFRYALKAVRTRRPGDA